MLKTKRSSGCDEIFPDVTKDMSQSIFPEELEIN